MWFHEKVVFFFHSCRFGFYLKFGYSETESYFKRAKTCQVPENGEISSMAAFFFLETQFSPKSSQIGAVAGAGSGPIPLHPALASVLREGASLVPKCHFFHPNPSTSCWPRGIRNPAPCRGLSAALSPTPDTCAWAGTIVEAPSIPTANRPALPQQKGPSSIKHQLSQGATGRLKKIISKRGLLVLTD